MATVVLGEVSPTPARVRPELPDPAELGAQARLPVDDLLPTEHPPR